MSNPRLTFWLHTVLGAVGGIVLWVVLYLLRPDPQPLGGLVRPLSLPVVWLFDGIVELFWHDNPDQAMFIYPLFCAVLAGYWAGIGIAVSWAIYRLRKQKA